MTAAHLPRAFAAGRDLYFSEPGGLSLVTPQRRAPGERRLRGRGTLLLQRNARRWFAINDLGTSAHCRVARVKVNGLQHEGRVATANFDCIVLFTVRRQQRSAHPHGVDDGPPETSERAPVPRLVEQHIRGYDMRLKSLSMVGVAALGLVAPVRFQVRPHGEGAACLVTANNAAAMDPACWCDPQLGGTGCTKPDWVVVCNASSRAQVGSSVHVEDTAWALDHPIV